VKAGKNLQTINPGDRRLRAYETKEVSVSPAPIPLHPYSSSYAQQQRSTSLRRDYGGRSTRYHDLENLKAWQLDLLHEADRRASAIGLPLNHFMSINHHCTEHGPAAMAATFALGIKRMGQWFRDNGYPAAYCYVHENPDGIKPNTHILIHVPRRLLAAFKARVDGWFQISLDGGIDVAPRNDAWRAAKGLFTRLQYMSKGGAQKACEKYGGFRYPGGQGPIPFKRAGASECLSSKSSQASFSLPSKHARKVAA
jgi:hypothetical protein